MVTWKLNLGDDEMNRTALACWSSLIFASAALATPALAADDCDTLPGAVVIGGVYGEPFARPESVQWDPASETWFVSNQALAEVGDGYIAALNADGSTRDARWVENLGNPTGVRPHGGKLYVADSGLPITVENEPGVIETWRSAIVVIDIATATVERTIHIDPRLLNGGGVNDPVYHAGNDAVYVSAFAGLTPGTVLKVPMDGSPPSQLAPPAEIADGGFGRPNGIVLRGADELIVTTISGDVLRVDLGRDDVVIEVLASVGSIVGGFDGVEPDGRGALLGTNNAPGGVGSLHRVRFHPNGSITAWVVCQFAPLHQPADLGIDRDRGVIAIPHLNRVFGNKITFLPLDGLPGPQSSRK